VSGAVHHYRVHCSWTGSTGTGYEAYDRHHVLRAPPSEEELHVSADPAFRGDARLLNPESMLVAAAVSCQLLSFLAVAARARIDVVAYDDDAQAVMDDGDPPARVNRIELRPRITVRSAVPEERIRHLCEVAHRECFIANSLRSDIVVSPTVTLLGPELPA